MKRQPTVKTIHVPEEYADLADAQTHDLVRRCCADPNIVAR
jgi:hypothetical protein